MGSLCSELRGSPSATIARAVGVGVAVGLAVGVLVGVDVRVGGGVTVWVGVGVDGGVGEDVGEACAGGEAEMTSARSSERPQETRVIATMTIVSAILEQALFIRSTGCG